MFGSTSFPRKMHKISLIFEGPNFHRKTRLYPSFPSPWNPKTTSPQSFVYMQKFVFRETVPRNPFLFLVNQSNTHPYRCKLWKFIGTLISLIGLLLMGLFSYTWKIYANKVLNMGSIYGFWKYLNKDQKQAKQRYIEMFYNLHYRNLVCCNIKLKF